MSLATFLQKVSTWAVSLQFYPGKSVTSVSSLTATSEEGTKLGPSSLNQLRAMV